jgi:hypothetical protein
MCYKDIAFDLLSIHGKLNCIWSCDIKFCRLFYQHCVECCPLLEIYLIYTTFPEIILEYNDNFPENGNIKIAAETLYQTITVHHTNFLVLHLLITELMIRWMRLTGKA